MLAIYYAYQKSQPGDTVRRIITHCIIHKAALKSSKDGNLSYADNFYDVIKEMPDLNEALIRYLMKDR